MVYYNNSYCPRLLVHKLIRVYGFVHTALTLWWPQISALSILCYYSLGCSNLIDQLYWLYCYSMQSIRLAKLVLILWSQHRLTAVLACNVDVINLYRLESTKKFSGTSCRILLKGVVRVPTGSVQSNSFTWSSALLICICSIVVHRHMWYSM